MSKAILGSFADPTTLELLDEIRALRARVAALEEALEEAERVADRHLADDPAVVVVEDTDADGRALDPAGTAAV